MRGSDGAGELDPANPGLRRSVDSADGRFPPESHSITPLMVTEAAVRRCLRDEVLASVEQPSEAVYEFWVPRSNERADVAVIGALMSGYEIKTERDTLKRLPRQAAAYARLFDLCTVVLAERHIAAAMEMLPGWWGVIAISENRRPPSFVSIRTATPNECVDPETLVRLLWRDEVRAILTALGDEPDPRASRSSMWRQLLRLVDINRLKALVRTALLDRNPNLVRFRTRRFVNAEVRG